MGGKAVNSTVISLRVANATLEHWRMLAARGGLTVAQWIADILPKPLPPMKNHNEDGPFS